VGWLTDSGVRMRAFEFDVVSAQAVEEKRVAVSGAATLTVENEVGDLSVEAGAVDEMVISITKTAWGQDQAEADARLADLQVTVTQSGNAVRVVVTKPDELSLVGNDRSDQVDLAVLVPAETTVTAETGFGDLTAAGLTGDVTLATNAGAVTARQITGSLDLRSDFGNVSVFDVTGEAVLIDSNSGRLQLERVQVAGALEAHSDFGAITLTDSGSGELDLSSNSGNLTLTGVMVTGAVVARTEFGGVTLTGVQADDGYDLETNSGGITVDGGRGRLKAHTDFGSIRVTNLEDASLDLYTNSGTVEFSGSLGAGPHSVTTEFGDARLTLPPDTALALDLSTGFGRISSEFAVTLSGDLEEERWQGTLNGGGESLTIHTDSGDIALLRASS
jgi:DUF4097 and DUF4098 domain-containing protein YvlB